MNDLSKETGNAGAGCTDKTNGIELRPNGEIESIKTDLRFEGQGYFLVINALRAIKSKQYES
jgi:hypothetical protein